MHQSSSSKPTYRSEIDGLRAFAVLSVVAFHAFPSWLKGGFIGVDVFFVISGFLITSHIFENLDKGRFSFTDFFGRRIRRIFPALTLVMTCSLVFGWFVLLAGEYAQLGKHVASGAAFVINFILVDESGYFDNVAETKPMLHLWSLAVEEQFYIVWPLMLWLAWRRQVNLLTVTIVIVLISFYLNLHFVDSDPIATFFWPAGRFWELLSGSVLAWLFLYKSDLLFKFKLWIDRYLVKIIHTKDMVADGTTALNLMSFFGLLLLAFGVVRINEGFPFPSTWALVPVFGALLVISSGPKAWLNRVLLMNPIAVWFGLISYPLYLWHWPILSFLQIIEGEYPHRSVRIGAVFLSVMLAWLTYRFVERPIRFGSLMASKTILLIILIGGVGAGGLYISHIGGHTPYNAYLAHIAEAKGDWAYPEGLERGQLEGVFYTSKKPPEVVFLGDSHIEQYGPRVVDLYRRGFSKEIAFVTGGGCPPIPNVYEDRHKYCYEMIEIFKEVLSQNDIRTIIIGAHFYSYLGGGHTEGVGYQHYFKDVDEIVPLYKKKGVELAKKSFFKFVSDLSKAYKVVVLLDIPTDDRFDPSKLLSAKNGRRPIPLVPLNPNKLSFPQAEYQVLFTEKMKKNLLELNVEFVNQAELICPDGLCLPVIDKGKPIYKDSGHMRPFFVKEHMNVLDPYFLRSK